MRNTARFQEQLAAALGSPAGQRRSGVWKAMDLAAEDIGAAGILTASFDGADQVLRVGLFFPHRKGWAFFGKIQVDGPDERAQIDQLIEDLLVTVDRVLNPVVDEIASRDE